MSQSVSGSVSCYVNQSLSQMFCRLVLPLLIHAFPSEMVNYYIRAFQGTDYYTRDIFYHNAEGELRSVHDICMRAAIPFIFYLIKNNLNFCYFVKNNFDFCCIFLKVWAWSARGQRALLWRRRRVFHWPLHQELKRWRWWQGWLLSLCYKATNLKQCSGRQWRW